MKMMIKAFPGTPAWYDGYDGREGLLLCGHQHRSEPMVCLRDGRPVVIGMRNHQDTPLILMTRSFPLGPLPQMIGDLLERLRTEMPARQQAHEAAEAKKKADAEARAEAARQRAAQVRAKVAEHKAQPATPAKKVSIVPDFGDDDTSQPAAPAAQASLLENV